MPVTATMTIRLAATHGRPHSMTCRRKAAEWGQLVEQARGVEEGGLREETKDGRKEEKGRKTA